MASYATLGSRMLIATADTTGQNTGNFTCWFSPAVVNVNIPVFEVYHVIFSGANLLDTVTIDVGATAWSFAAAGFGGGAEWDPANPLLLIPGNDLYFYWSTPTSSTTTPVVTIWLRYDEDLAANQGVRP
jgi:hypothetical protein